MVYYWISFSIIFVLIITGIPMLKEWGKEHSKKYISPEMDKNANIKVVKLISFYIFCDLFYMSCFINNLICKYVFGGLIMLNIFMNLANAFTFPSKRNLIDRWGLVQDFIIGIGLSVYLIYLIPNHDILNIVLPIVAALYGGLLTLVGVAWTIRNQEMIRKEEKLLEIKPHISLSNITGDHKNIFVKLPTLSSEEVCELNEESDSKIYEVKPIFIRNSMNSNTILDSVIINGEQIKITCDNFIEKGKVFLIADLYYLRLQKFDMKIIMSDICENKYFYELKFDEKLTEKDLPGPYDHGRPTIVRKHINVLSVKSLEMIENKQYF